jgi:DNA-binding MarR family transcriptional regulator
MARKIWLPITAEIEKRWEERFGVAEIGRLRTLLSELIARAGMTLPDHLPILGYGLFSAPDPLPAIESAADLPSLLSKTLLAFAIEFESQSCGSQAGVSLAISANVLRLVGEEGTRVRDLPAQSGVSKEAIATALSWLEKQRYAVKRPDPEGSRAKVVFLTARGEKAKKDYERTVASIEMNWRSRVGKELIRDLRGALKPIAEDLFQGLVPYKDCWRAMVPQPEVLPHYPMILHRGGYPDGS